MIQDTSSQDVILTGQSKKSSVLKLLLIASICGITIIFAYPTLINWSSIDKNIDRTRVRIATVTKGDFIRDIALQGNIVAANSPKLYAPTEGTVNLIVNPGDLVNKGDLIATINSPSLSNRLLQEKAHLASLVIALERQAITGKQATIKSRQQIQLEKVLLEAAKREQRRAQHSLKIQALSQLDYEKSVDELKRSQLKYDFAVEQAQLETENLAFELKTRESEVNQYQLQLDNTERLVSELNITAPVSGVIGSWSVEQKSAVALNQPLLTVVDLSAFQVEIDIPESYADSLGIGMPVKVEYNNKEYSANIITISPEVNEHIVKGRVAFSAETPPGIKQNQRVSSRVILEHKNSVLYLPRGSFIQHHAGLKVFVVENQIAALTEVSLGSRSIEKIEILSGLNEGQQVIISNTDFVKDAKTLSLN